MNLLLPVRRLTDLLRVGSPDSLSYALRRDPSRTFEVGLPANTRLPRILIRVPKQNLTDAVTPVDFVLLGAQQTRIGQKMLPVVECNNLGPFRLICNYRIADGPWLRPF